MSTTPHDLGRGRDQRPRPGGASLERLVVASVVAALLVGAAWVVRADGDDQHPVRRAGPATFGAVSSADGGPQVLGGELRAGVPTVQRQVHDGAAFTVSVAPAQPGANLVRVDVTGAGHEHGAEDTGSAEPAEPTRVGVDEAHLVEATARPGTDGLWAVVDLPEGESTVLVTHEGDHRVPFPVVTGERRTASSAWTGADGPECLSAAIATRLAGGTTSVRECAAEELSATDAAALRDSVGLLSRRGVTELALASDDTPRSEAARAEVARAASSLGVAITDPAATPGPRNALLDVSGWTPAAQALAEVSSTPLEQQRVRTDGTWLAPWLLSPGVVDSTAGAVLPLAFDIRDEGAKQYAGTLQRVLPGQSPTASGYAAWRTARGEEPGDPQLYAASRAAYMPAQAGHEAHETQVAWFPGGTITPVGVPLT